MTQGVFCPDDRASTEPARYAGELAARSRFKSRCGSASGSGDTGSASSGGASSSRLGVSPSIRWLPYCQPP